MFPYNHRFENINIMSNLTKSYKMLFCFMGIKGAVKDLFDTHEMPSHPTLYKIDLKEFALMELCPSNLHKVGLNGCCPQGTCRW